jgi:hypothetical protein
MPKLHTKVKQAEVFGSWLKYEYENKFNVKDWVNSNFSNIESIIVNPDFNEQEQNQKRLDILHEYRSFIESIPVETEWWIASINENDMRELRLISTSAWRDLTSGTLSPLDCAKRINEDHTLKEPYVRFILDNYQRLSTTPSRPIIIGPKSGPLTVIDGVHRIVSYSLFYFIRKEKEFMQKEVYLGLTQLPFEMEFAL